jgi:hydrophobic/amphiphilic exporter-1 (mainly G- bacteria), HAE1 family
MIILIIMILGGVALSRLGIDLMPDISYPTLTVMVRYPGAPSEEIESIVARNYEAAFASVSGVKKVKSVSQEDVCYFMLDFVWGTDLNAAAADLRESVAMIEPYMPDGVEDPIVLKFDLSSIPLAFLVVSGMDDTVRLRKIMTDTVQDRLERLPGVAQAAFAGGRTEEIRVDVDRAALQDSGVSLDQVVMALRFQNLDLPAGRQVQARQERLLRSLGLFLNLDDIRAVPVGVSRGTGLPIELGGIANVHRSTQDLRTLVRANRTEALMGIITKESGANPLKVRTTYLAELEKLKKALPSEIKIETLFDMGKIISQMAGTVVRTGLEGALLSIIVVFVFLWNWRPTAIVAVAIPFSLLTTFLFMYLAGFTLNMMTMGGLVLGIGMLVDDAVVVIENIFRHIEEGEDRKTASAVGASEVGMAVIASTLTTIVVFVPILFAQGLAGQLSRGLALTVTAALLASLIVALTIVPMLGSLVLATRGTGSAIGQEGRWFLVVKSRYQTLVGWCLHHRLKVLGFVGIAVLLSGVAFVFVGKEFMPAQTMPVLAAKISFPVGTPLSETSAASAVVEDTFAKFPDVLSVGSQIGVNEDDPGSGMSDSNPAGVNEAMIFARLKDNDREYGSNDALQEAVRLAMPTVEGMKFEFTSMDSGMGGSTWPIEVKIFGSDLDELREIASEVRTSMVAVPGLADVKTTFNVAKPERHIKIDRDRAGRFGLAVGQVASAVQTATLGTVATRFREKGDELDVRVRYAEPYRDTDESLRQVLIPLPMGGTIPLDQVASIEDGMGPVKIVREDQRRVVSVVSNLTGTDLGTAMAGVRTAVDPISRGLPQGYSIDYAGQYEDMQDTFGQLVLALLLAILMVYMVMASQFESFSHPFTIMFTMPLAVIGVVWILLFTGTSLSVSSFVGIIMLAGIVVKNGIVMVDYINQLRAKGMEILEATAKGAATRLRPVLITSLTTIIGTMPMAFSHGQGSGMTAPLARTIIGGLTAATFLTLLVVPVVYTYVDGASKSIKVFWLRRLHRAEFEAQQAG